MSYWQPVEPLRVKRGVSVGLFVLLMVAAASLASGRALGGVVELLAVGAILVSAVGAIAARTNRRLRG
jgi:hypothetical protein